MTKDYTMLDTAIEYLDQGLSVIPVKKSDKRPYIKWAEYQKRLPTEEEVTRWWSVWPDANIAIVTGAVSGLFCVDADGPAGIEWINANLPKTSVYSKTAKGIHAIYKTNGSLVQNAVRLAPEVDIRGEGGYFVAPPSIHNTGHQYEWVFELNGWEDLAEYSIPSASKLNLDLTHIKTPVQNIPVKKGSRNSSLAQLAGRWINMGLDDDEVETLARAWNNKNTPPLGEKELLRTIQSIKKTHYRKNPLPAENLTPAELLYPSVPEHLLNPGGLLSDLMDYITKNSTVSVPFFSLASSLVFIGNLLGQKVQTETGLRTNIYAISLGYSGSGKNAPFNTLPQLLLRTNAAKSLGPGELASSTALLKWLSIEGQRVSLLMLDEIGSVLKGLKNPNSSQADIPRVLTKLFSSTDRPEVKAYASGDTITIPYHHVSLYGASTPERFWESLTSGDITDGFLARVLIFESLHDAPLPDLNIRFNLPKDLIKKINRVIDIEVKMDKERGNLDAVPIPKTIPFEDEARTLFQKWAEKYHHLKNKKKESDAAPIYGRVAENGAKIALIHAVGMGQHIIGIESVKWTCELMDYLIGNMIQAIKSNIADNETDKWKQKLIKGIRAISRKKESAGATLRDIQRGPGRGLLRKELEKYLDSLLISEEISSREEIAKNGRVTVQYYVTMAKSESDIIC